MAVWRQAMHNYWMMTIALAAAAPAAAQEAPEAPRPGTVAIEPLAKEAGPATVRQVFADAVERALMDARFTALPATSRSRYVARMKLTRTARGAVTSNAKEEGMATAIGNWGAAIGVTLPSDKRQLRGLIVTELEVEILLREGMQRVWSGRAVTAQAEGTKADAPAALAAKLAPAVIRRFPAQSDEAISIP
ncbi:hypothetical protein OK349_09475 [Sphingomonas sp. BT-65]|uniref:hypothetical protein n=1 Tax=Sphingomonas sp. BT-65 TaxID=2989821 RepID=UPI002236AB17|nr:hypothetical protein [Sphingomonas sp. BT-65]MCW4461937.1 hypothetical protein [Sphingomonas sp. BT-65]